MTNLIRCLIKISLSDKLSYLNLNKYSHHNSTNAASGILINDIIAIMESSANIGITVNPIEDNIFQWQVLLKDFNGKLAEDLNFVNGSYDYDYIELQLDFSMVRNYSHMIFFFHELCLKIALGIISGLVSIFSTFRQSCSTTTPWFIGVRS